MNKEDSITASILELFFIEEYSEKIRLCIDAWSLSSDVNRTISKLRNFEKILVKTKLQINHKEFTLGFIV